MVKTTQVFTQYSLDLGYLSHDESLTSEPGAWLVKKKFFYMHAITKLQKRPRIENLKKCHNMFHSYDRFYILSKGPTLKFVMVAHTLKKTINPKTTCRVFKLDS